MKGIVLTAKQRGTLYDLINEFYDKSSYGSFKNFKTEEKCNIVDSEIGNDLFMLSPTVMDVPIYSDLKEFIFSKMTTPLLMGEIFMEDKSEED